MTLRVAIGICFFANVTDVDDICSSSQQNATSLQSDIKSSAPLRRNKFILITRNTWTGEMLNLFYQIHEPTIICALPDGGALPSFLKGDAWRYGGKVSEIYSEQSEYDRASINAMVCQNGFYIYTRALSNVRRLEQALRVAPATKRRASTMPLAR